MCFTVVAAAEYATTIVVETTSDVLNFTFLDDLGVYAASMRQLVFSVRAESDAHIALSK